MADSPQQEKVVKELSRQAAAFAETMAKRAVNREVLAEIVNHLSLWTDFRVEFKQHMRICEELTTVTMAANAKNALAGWLVESRKADCGAQHLADADVETIARTVPQIRRNFQLTGVRRVPLDDQRGFAAASFAGPAKADAWEVTVNPTTGAVIGYLPLPVGKLAPVPTDDADAKQMAELAWKQIQTDLKLRVSAEAAANAREVLKLTPVTAARDEAGRQIRVFKLWRFYSTCDVAIDEATKEVIGWYMEALQSDAPERSLAEHGAVQSARTELKAADGVQGPTVSFERSGDAEKATVHWWHAEDGVTVEGDQTTVFLNATTGKIYSVARKWRKIPRELLKPPAIAEEQALRAADRAVQRDPAQPAGNVLGKKIIQLTADPEQPGPVRDALVWRVGYASADGLKFTEASVDCQTGEVVRVTGW